MSSTGLASRFKIFHILNRPNEVKTHLMVRVRFAPSPTGYLHVGGARAALFNWLFARHHKGIFILRMEDTDRTRSAYKFERAICDDLRYLGLDWDEGLEIGGDHGPYRQSEKLDVYRKCAKRLLKEELAYHCYCSAKELDLRRREALRKGIAPRYDNRCRNLTSRQVEEYRREGRRPAMRFKVPSGKVVVSDIVRGDVTFDCAELGDFIILRSDGVAAFLFANAIDDGQMTITHVIRGEDHLSNTPRQILLYRALGFNKPRFAHLPMILGPDHTRLSKRHGAASIAEYRRLGYLPEALLNYLALLGWYPPDGQEINSPKELIEEFSLEHVGKPAAIFDVDKLNWMNGYYIRHADLSSLTDLAIPYLREAGYLTASFNPERHRWLREIVGAVRGHLSCMSEITRRVDIFFERDLDIGPDVRKMLQRDQAREVLEALCDRLSRVADLTAVTFGNIAKELAMALGVKGKDLYLPIRAALTGRLEGPELRSVLPILGKEECIKRIKKALKTIMDYKL